MREWYFYQERGKTIGPLTADDLRLRIRDGRVRLFDMIFKEGEMGWRMAIEHSEFHEEFAKVDDGMKDKPWVCLRRKSPETFEFVTLGPFGTDDVRTQIQSGKLSYNDYIWRNGFAEWTRIGAVREFNPRAGTATAPPPEVPTKDELLKNVVELRRPSVEAPPPPPAEAKGPDLTKPFDPDATQVVSAKTRAKVSTVAPKTVLKGKVVVDSVPPLPQAPSPPPPPLPIVDDETDPGIRILSTPEARAARRRVAKWTDLAIVGGLFLILALVIGYLLLRLRETEQPPPPPLAQSLEATTPAQLSPDKPTQFGPETLPPLDSNPTPAKPAEPVEAIKPPAPEPKKLAPREPTQLTMTVGGGGNQARIELHSNGTSDVTLQIIGLPGQVTEGASFYRFLRLKSSGDSGRALVMPQLKLPAGRFVLHAETGNLRKDAILNLAVGETGYRQTLARNRKMHAAALWKERLTLYRLAVAAETAVGQAASGKKLSLRGLEPVLAVRKGNGGNYLFYEEWTELKDILTDARENPSAAVLERAKRFREHMAGLTVWKKS